MSRPQRSRSAGSREEEFGATSDVNVKAVFFTVQKLLPLLRDGALIVLNASAVSAKGLPAYSVDTATTAAVRSFAHVVRGSQGSKNPRKRRKPGAAPPKRSLSASLPLGRIGQAGDVASAAAFLASDDSSFITGIELFVDGGMAQV